MYRFDWEGIGAVKTRHLLKVLGLNSDGKPEQRATSSRGRPRKKSAKSSPIQLEVTNSAVWKDQEEAKADGSGSEKSPVQQDAGELQRKKSEMQLKQIKRTSSTKIQPRLENILDCLVFRVRLFCIKISCFSTTVKMKLSTIWICFCIWKHDGF